MYTKAQYLNDLRKYDFKNYKVEVNTVGDNANNLVFQVLFNDEIVYETRKGIFKYERIKSGRFVRTKWFVKYEPFEDVIITWKNNKDFMRFTSWCSNYKVQNDIKAKFQIAKDNFKRELYQNII